jgi:hypothetical protein
MTLTTTDNIAEIARLSLRDRLDQYGYLVGLRRHEALALIKGAVSDAAQVGNVYDWEVGDAVQKLMNRIVRNDQH